jgi:hypothetical protein
VLAPTCFGSSLPSSGSLLDPPELREITNGGVVYHITCDYVACVPACRGSMCCVLYMKTDVLLTISRSVLLIILCSLFFDIVILCITIFLLCFVLFIVRVLYCVCL